MFAPVAGARDFVAVDTTEPTASVAGATGLAAVVTAGCGGAGAVAGAAWFAGSVPLAGVVVVVPVGAGGGG